MNKNTTIANQQKSAINHYLNNHPQLSDGIKFINLEKLSKNEEFLTSYSIDDYDRNKLQSTLKGGSKYGVMFIDTDSVAIHNISKKELNTLSNLKDYEFDPVYKSVAKEMAQLAPNAPDTTINLGDFTSFDPNAFEDTFSSFDEDKKALNAFDMPGKAHSKNIDNAASSGINSNAQKEGKILGYITRKSFKMNKINKTPNMNNNEQNNQLFKQVEQTFTTNPLAAQWWVQNKKAISESLDNMYTDWENQRSHKESKKYGKISRKLTSEQISEFSKLYEKVHDMNGEHSLLPEEIEQKIEDESKFDQNNAPIVKEAQKLFTASPQNAKWYLQRNLAYNEDSDNLWRFFDGKKEQYVEQEKLTKLEKQLQLSDKQIAKLENYYQKTRDLNNPNSKYGRESKFTKETINQIFQLSKQQDVEKAIDKSPEREIRRQPFLVKKDNLHTQNDEKVLSKADEQLNRVYARKFLKENNFALSKENIQQVSQNIAKNRANNKKQNRDSSVEAAYKIEKEKLSDPATRSNYQKSSKKHTKNATINQTLLDQNLDL